MLKKKLYLKIENESIKILFVKKITTKKIIKK